MSANKIELQLDKDRRRRKNGKQQILVLIDIVLMHKMKLKQNKKIETKILIEAFSGIIKIFDMVGSLLSIEAYTVVKREAMAII